MANEIQNGQNNPNLPPPNLPNNLPRLQLQRGQRVYIEIVNGQRVNVPVPEHGVAHYVIDADRLAAALQNAPFPVNPVNGQQGPA